MCGKFVAGQKEVEATIILQTLKDKDPNAPSARSLSASALEESMPPLQEQYTMEDSTDGIPLGDDNTTLDLRSKMMK